MALGIRFRVGVGWSMVVWKPQLKNRATSLNFKPQRVLCTVMGVIPNMETLHSTISVHRTVWELISNPI